MTIPFPMPTFPSPTAAMPVDSVAFIARGNDNQIIAGLNQVEASIAALGHTLTFGTHLQAAGTSYNGSANVTIATDATSANTVSTIVARDTSGNFSANSVTLAGTLTLSSNGAILSGASGSKGLAITATTGEILDYSTTGQNGDMPAGGILVNSSLTTGHRALSIFANDGTAGITVGAYYFTNSAVETVFQYANAIGKAQGSTAFQFYPKGGEVSFGQNYAASGNTKAFIRMYGTTTSNAGGSATLIVQQGGITTDTLAASALISANGGLTVASGKTLTLTGVTVVGLSFTPITGTLTYAQLPTGNGTWDTGAGTLITIARSITVSGTTSTVGFTVSNTASFLNASPFSMSGGGGNVVTVAITLPTAGATVTIPDFAGVNDTFAFVTLAQTLANKTLASSCSVPASTLTGQIAYAALPSGNGSWDAGAGNTTTITRALTVGGRATANGGLQTNVSANDRWDNTATQIIYQMFTGTGGIGGGTAGGRYVMRFARGSIASPTVVKNADLLAGFQVSGYDGSSWIDSAAAMFVSTTQDWSVGANGTQWIFRTTPNGSATSLIAMTIGQDQSVTYAGLAQGTGNARFGPNMAIGPSGVVILSQVALRVASSITAVSGTAVVLDVPTTLIAAANNDTLIGIRTTQSYTPGSFTGLAIVAFQTAAISTATFTSPSDPRGVVIGAVTGSGITANAVNAVVLDLGAASGATNNISVRSANWNVLQSGAATFAGLAVNGLVTNYNSVATAGFGLQTIYASGRVTGKTNVASGTICTYTPAADGTFVIYANVNVTTSTTFSFTVTCTYTDEGGTARTQTFSFAQIGGAPIQTLTNVTGAGTYDGFPLTIRAKGANAITILTAPAGTYTAVVYNISGAIAQLAA